MYRDPRDRDYERVCAFKRMDLMFEWFGSVCYLCEVCTSVLTRGG